MRISFFGILLLAAWAAGRACAQDECMRVH